MIGNDEIQERVERSLILIRRDLGQPLTLPGFEIAIYHGPDQNAARAAAAEVNVLPILRIGGDFFLQTLARLRIFQASNHAIGAAFERPRRQARAQ